MSGRTSGRTNGWSVNSIASADVQTLHRDGREYLQFPLIPLTEMVLEYPEHGTSEYLPAEHIEETADLWDGALLTHTHPSNRDGTARDPDAFMGEVIGAFHDPEALDGGERLRGTGLIDVEKARDLGGHAAELVEQLQNGEEVSVSAGYRTTEDERRAGHHEGDAYDLVQGAPLPDHIAVFPSDAGLQARCSPEDGCAAPRANYVAERGGPIVTNSEDDSMSDQSATVFTDETERARAIETIREHYDIPAEELTEEFDDAQILLAARNEGYRGPGCDCEDAVCECLFPDGIEQYRENARQRTNRIPGVHTSPHSEHEGGLDIQQADEERGEGVSGRIPGVVDHSRSRSEWEAERGSERKANMRGVPGHVDRTPQEPKGGAEEFPGGGRKAWEQRKVNATDEDTAGAETDYPLTRARKNAERVERRRIRQEWREARKRSHGYTDE